MDPSQKSGHNSLTKKKVGCPFVNNKQIVVDRPRPSFSYKVTIINVGEEDQIKTTNFVNHREFITEKPCRVQSAIELADGERMDVNKSGNG